MENGNNNQEISSSSVKSFSHAQSPVSEQTHVNMQTPVSEQKYEALYNELLDRGYQLHQSNKKRIRMGIILLIILPIILDTIRILTDSDKVVFLIIWILIMFVLSAYLISIEYLDSSVENTLKDVTDTEAEFDGLLSIPELRKADLYERIRERIEQRLTEPIESESEDHESGSRDKENE